MTVEQITEFCKVAVEMRLENFNNAEVLRFTPSIKMGRRYVGFKINDQQFMIEINVTEA